MGPPDRSAVRRRVGAHVQRGLRAGRRGRPHVVWMFGDGFVDFLLRRFVVLVHHRFEEPLLIREVVITSTFGDGSNAQGCRPAMVEQIILRHNEITNMTTLASNPLSLYVGRILLGPEPPPAGATSLGWLSARTCVTEEGVANDPSARTVLRGSSTAAGEVVTVPTCRTMWGDGMLALRGSGPRRALRARIPQHD